MKRLTLFLLIALGTSVLTADAENLAGNQAASLGRQVVIPAIAEFSPAPNKTQPVQLRGRDAGSRPKSAPIVKEFAPPAPKMGPSFRQFKTTAVA